MNKTDRIYIAGHTGLVGSEILKYLKLNEYENVIIKSQDELDLTIQKDVEHFFDMYKPEYVFVAAAKVGGIYANSTYPADFGYINTMISTNIIHNSYKYKVKKLLLLGSSCIYPKHCPQPIKEEYFLSDYLEPTNIAYAIAKINSIILSQKYNEQYGTNFISLMPTNMYGSATADNYDEKSSHVLPGMIKKFHDAKIQNKEKVELWGTGTPLREFLHVKDFVDGCLFLMNNYDSVEIINIGTNDEISIRDLSLMIRDIIGFEGFIDFNKNMPDGTPRKKLDTTKINNLGWYPKIKLKNGITELYKELCEKNDLFK